MQTYTRISSKPSHTLRSSSSISPVFKSVVLINLRGALIGIPFFVIRPDLLQKLFFYGFDIIFFIVPSLTKSRQTQQILLGAMFHLTAGDIR